MLERILSLTEIPVRLAARAMKRLIQFGLFVDDCLDYIRKRDRLKQSSLAVICMILVSVMVWLSSSILEAATRHDDKMQFLSQQLDPLEIVDSIVEWDVEEQPEGRNFSETDGDILGEALTDAWKNMLLAGRSHDSIFLEDNFEGAALKNAKEILLRKKPKIDRGMAVLTQTVKPRFFHLDGTIAELSSDDTLSVRYEIDEAEDKINFLSINRECIRLVMFLETSGWSIRNHEVDCIKPLNDVSKKVSKRELNLPIKGMNYYPANSPWKKFWESFDETAINDDMKLMEDVGVNSVRVFLPFEYFLEAETKIEALEKFDKFVTLAKTHKISVIPTLFDFRNNYDPLQWAAEYQYVKGIAQVIKKHDNITILDLKNEPDLDYEYHGQAKVDMWLITFSSLVKDLLPDRNITIGWLRYESAIKHESLVDVLSYHEYSTPTEAKQVYAKTKMEANGKPVIISEIGKPSWSLFGGLPYSPKSQANWLKAQFDGLSDSDGVMVWTLHDFSYEDVGRVARLPWRRALQAHYGMIDRDGTHKPSLEVFREFSLNDRAKQIDWGEVRKKANNQEPIEEDAPTVKKAEVYQKLLNRAFGEPLAVSEEDNT